MSFGTPRSAFATPEDLEAALGARLRGLRLERNLDLRALDRVEWLATIAPVASINPLTLPRAGTVRQRASTRRKKDGP